MQFSWLIKNNSEKLILFFNGWSVDERIVSHLRTSLYDVIMFNDYNNLNLPKDIELNHYKEINIIAWSFGVWASSSFINQLNNLKAAIAINGTLLPVDNNLGIPEKIFSFTLKTLNEKSYIEFFKNMFSEFSDDYFKKLPNRSIEDQEQELRQIHKQSKASTFYTNARFYTKAIISNQDKIIPTKNQSEFWTKNNCNKIIYVDKGHCIFDLFKNWEDIINYGEC